LEELNKDAVKFEDEDTVGGAPAPDKPDTGGDSAGTPPQTTTEAAAVAPTSSGSTSAADSKVVQSYTYVFNFSVDGAAGPDLRAREVATDWAGAVFGEGARAEEDTTGMQVWATALISSRWIAQLQASPVSAFAGKRVIELGAGAGVPGLCALFYSKATKVCACLRSTPDRPSWDSCPQSYRARSSSPLVIHLGCAHRRLQAHAQQSPV
jgi:hypothetical protein